MTHHSFDWIQNNEVRLTLSKEAGSNVITASFKHNLDSDWTNVGSTELALSESTVQVGIAVTAGDGYEYALAQLDVKEYDVVD